MLIVILYLGVIFFAVAELRVLVMVYFLLAQRRRRTPSVNGVDWPGAGAAWPSVVVQLPVYREHKVLSRLLSAVVTMQYPPGRLAVQVLDDSEGEDARVAADIVAAHRDGAVRVDYVHRSERAGYKSGALNYGHRRIEGDLVAIFDADFVPHTNFLLRTVPAFREARVGAVHARWDFVNDSASPLTMLQAGVLESLFCFDGIRQSMGESSIYLGTNGVWRRSVIDDLGGWREAPFTDDGIDLSCRAQIAGWGVSFVDEALSSSELPETYLAYKSQQRRWARAALRLFFDHWRQPFIRSSGFGNKFLELSLLHLEFSMPCLLLVALVTGLYVVLGLPRSGIWLAAQIALMAALVLFPPALEVLLSQKVLHCDWRRRGVLVLRALPLAIGVSVSVLAGFWDTLRRSTLEFVPTPRRGADAVIGSSTSRWLASAARIAAVEIMLGVVVLLALIAAVVRRYPESWLLLLVVSSAFLIAGWTSVREILEKLRRP